LPKRRRGQRTALLPILSKPFVNCCLRQRRVWIAGLLNRNAKTGNASLTRRASRQCARATTSRVQPAYEWIRTLAQLRNAAKLLKIAPKTLRLAAEPARSKPAIRYRTPVGSSPALLITTAAGIARPNERDRTHIPGSPHPHPQSLFFHNITDGGLMRVLKSIISTNRLRAGGADCS